MENTELDAVRFIVDTARTNFAAFVAATHRPRFKHSAFSANVCQAIDQFVADVIAGKRPVLILTAPPQHGKLIASHVPVLTRNRGWITHGELCVGDVVYRPDGHTTTIVAVGPSMPADMRVTFSDGEVIGTHSHHEWLLHDNNEPDGSPSQVFETQDIARKGATTPVGALLRDNFRLPDVRPLENPMNVALPVAPYALGVWLGCGALNEGHITLLDTDDCVAQGIIDDGYEAVSQQRYREVARTWYFPELTRGLSRAGLLKHAAQSKRIPNAYFVASYAQRLALLAGLLDAAGSGYSGRATITHTDMGLVRDIQRLIATFGLRIRTARYPLQAPDGVAPRSVARVSFTPAFQIPCRLASNQQLTPQSSVAHTRERTITKVERGDFGWGNCIQVEHPDGMYLVGDHLIPTHNSSLISRCLPPYLMGRLHGHLPFVNVGCVSYAHSLAQRNRRDAQAIMLSPVYREIFPDVSLIGFRGVDNASDGLETPAGWLKAVGIGGGLTGHSLSIGVIDDGVKNAQEALSPVTQERNRDWFDSVLLTRLQQQSGLVVMGTPWSGNDILAYVKNMYRDYENCTILSFPALNLPDEIGYREDMPEGALVPHLHSEAKLREFKRNIAESWWAALYQSTPLADLGATFPRSHLQYFRRADLPKQFVDVIMSVDATFKDGASSDYVAVGVWGKTQDGRVWLLGKRREKLDFMATAQAIVDLKSSFPNVRRVFIEEAANGAALISMLKRQFPQIEGVPPLGSKVARAAAVAWVWSNDCVMLPHPDEDPGIAPWVNEICAFPDAANDDTVDCMSIALYQLCLRTPIASLITREILDRA